MRSLLVVYISVFFSLALISCDESSPEREIISLNNAWEFSLLDSLDQPIRQVSVNLPHDWSIEGAFSKNHPAGVGGGALPGGKGIYTKTISPDHLKANGRVFLEFDGVYQNSTVYINDLKVGNRPNGYISFNYDITDYIMFGQLNTITVEVDNSLQPNSRWYSGSGIYRDVRLVYTPSLHVPQYGVFVQSEITPSGSAKVIAEVEVSNKKALDQSFELQIEVFDPSGNSIWQSEQQSFIQSQTQNISIDSLLIDSPQLWSPEEPNLYTMSISLLAGGKNIDRYTQTFGLRTVQFDPEKGFFLNGKSMKIKGVCLHHDLGALGAAFNLRAMERQLEIMRRMGVNAIRTAHNPPAPQVLELCDQMGIMVMDEMFDMWSLSKSKYDYSTHWDEWHEQDLKDFIKRDRNHPSIIAWSIGNEIIEQYNHEDSLGGQIAKRLVSIVQSLDASRPVTTANNDTSPENTLIKNGGMNLVGYNYHHEQYVDFPKDHPGKSFIATETNSGLATRGYYDQPSDSVRIWPESWDKPFTDGNPEHTVSAYDHVRVPWGSLQNETWPIIRDHDFMSGMFIWTGFDYLGEPTPYGWPSRSSYFGIVDLAGFPKDTYYYYQGEWTSDTILHVFPHWNWTEGQEVDVWAYYSIADEVELYLNGQSLGIKSKGDSSHVMWRVPFKPGELKAVSRLNGKIILEKTIYTAGKAKQIQLTADRQEIVADGHDLSFITIEILDEQGTLVPKQDLEINFTVEGAGILKATDNGDPTDHTSFQSEVRKTLHGKCLAIVQSTEIAGELTLTASAKGLPTKNIQIRTVSNH